LIKEGEEKEKKKEKVKNHHGGGGFPGTGPALLAVQQVAVVRCN
jgi:hypothetical protein